MRLANVYRLGRKELVSLRYDPVLVIRIAFNPNTESAWFLSAMQLINMATLLGIVLPGAALIREREHGTIEHLLVMPLGPAEIMLAKIWANAAVIVAAASLSLLVVVRGVLALPLAGSVPLWILGLAVVWPHLLVNLAIGAVCFAAVLGRFRRTVSLTRI